MANSTQKRDKFIELAFNSGAIEGLTENDVKEYRTVPMMQGNKISRFIAWRY